MTNFKEKIKNLLNNKDNRVILKNITGAFLIKGLSLFISLFTLPAYMKYLNDNIVLGLWFTIVSIISWILSFDLGIGNGLRNNLVNALTNKDDNRIKKLISSSYFMIGIISLILLIIGNIVLRFIDWNKFFNISVNLISNKTLLKCVRYVFIAIVLQFFFKLINSILYALQKSAINNLLSLITSILMLLFVLLAPKYTIEKNLEILAFSNIILINVPLLIVTLIIFAKDLKKYKPNIKSFEMNSSKAILSLGGIFLICQILYMFIANTNEFFISKYWSADKVVEYQIYFKLFGLVGTLAMLALTPLWSAVTKAFVENNFIWLKKLFKTMKVICLLIIIGEFLLIPLLQFIIKIWLKEKAIDVNYVYAVNFAIFGSIFIWLSVVNTVANGFGKMKLQFVSFLFGVIFKFLIIHFGRNIINDWILVIISNSIILLPYCIIQQVSINNFINKKIKE